MDVYILVVQDRDALNKHIDCEMKCRGSCSGGGGREKECVILGIVATSFIRTLTILDVDERLPWVYIPKCG